MALLERFPALIWRSGLDAGCTYFNHTWLEFTGRSLEQELGHGWTASIHPDDFDRCIAGYLGHFAARTPIEMEYRLRRHDGEYRWLIDTGQPIHDEAGEFTGYIGFCLDITARRNTEAELRERETRMRTLLASMGEGVIVRDANGLLQLHNAAAAAILGVSDAEMSLLDCRADLLSYLDEDGEPIARSQIPPCAPSKPANRPPA